MARLSKIEIKGYRSIKDMALELGPVNILIGANGAGKSNFVSFFKMLNEMIVGRLQEYIAKSGRGHSILHFGPKVTPQLESRLSFAESDIVESYYFRLVHGANDELLFSREELPYKIEGQSHQSYAAGGRGETGLDVLEAEGYRPAKACRQILNNLRVYHFHDTTSSARMRQSGYIHDNRRLLSDATNLAAVLYAYRQGFRLAYNRIVATMRKILPEFEDFDLEPSRLNSNDIILNWRKRGWEYLFGPHQLSDGTLRAMALCTVFLQPAEHLPDVIILDEPELGLHPFALEIIAGLMHAVSAKTQVIAATQSQSLLNFFLPSEVITVECPNGQSRFRRLEAAQLADWLEDYSLGELWQRNVLGGGPLP